MKNNFAALALMASMAVFMSACTSSTQETPPEQAAPVVQEDTPGNTAAQQDTIKKSIPSQAQGAIGGTSIKISYHAPGVRGRVIWGGLVALDQVWVTGAHKATAVTFDKEVIIDGKEVAAGTYAFFTIPGKEEWTIILNKDHEQHLADNYDQEKDILRVKVSPEILGQHQERLKFEITSTTPTKGAITVAWDKVRVYLPVSTDA
ncbi:DUF2911 domain-containing protein [Rufibacter tibetensis]|uniref:DUF2911 domain-containing protein n=1 Tax=Rufibacter tibetensis TaxID=512763 RepID=UPI0009005731|nr:DUF2911 domain-containing protein [Rufibacter tibetensis]